MSKKVLCVSSGIVFIALITAVISGCTSRVSIADKGHISVEKRGTEKIEILWVDVFQEDDQIWVYGVLKQPSITGGPIKTHVDIQILAPDGSVQYEAVSKEFYVPRNRVGKGPDWKRFSVKVDKEIQKRSKVLVKVHNGKDDECFKEMAMLR